MIDDEDFSSHFLCGPYVVEISAYNGVKCNLVSLLLSILNLSINYTAHVLSLDKRCSL